ncbi:hypothetical protein AB4Z10_17165 [Bosea sp. RAF48]|uniref:hypothetical protein n=1 Tax=Bosea sp. RAF48 TaxID=3237480 RepID=UPI003F92E442
MSADTAPAAMPSEEDVARALCIAQGNNPDFDYDPNGVSDAPGTNLCWKLYLGQARAIIALFAPILADARTTNSQGWRQMALDEHQKRLAAEAALAAEKERCIAIVDAQVRDWVKERSGPYWEGYRDAMEDATEDMRKGVPRAAAIRAQGE